MEQDLLLHVDRPITPFDPQRIAVWEGVNLRKESQGPSRIADNATAHTQSAFPLGRSPQSTVHYNGCANSPPEP